jgi:hypothetical protein
MSCRGVVVVGLVLLAGSARAWAQQEKDAARKPVPLYTNEDLERMSPFRDQTGVSSTPALAPPVEVAPAARSRRAAADGPVHGETYWRRQAEVLHDRLQRSRDRMDDLRARIAAREAQTGSRTRRTPSATDAQLDAWRRQLALLEARVRETEARFEDRARREGALPGWIR